MPWMSERDWMENGKYYVAFFDAFRADNSWCVHAWLLNLLLMNCVFCFCKLVFKCHDNNFLLWVIWMGERILFLEVVFFLLAEIIGAADVN